VRPLLSVLSLRRILSGEDDLVRSRAQMKRRKRYPIKPGAGAPSPFALLNAEHQRESVLRLVDARVPVDGIAQMVGWCVADVLRVIAERAPPIGAHEGLT
jgi:hypothetical protein